MARRRVFKTTVDCSGIDSRTKRRLLAGQAVTVQKSASGEVEVALDDGTVLGNLDPAIGSQVAPAIDRGQSFTASIENVYQLPNRTTRIHLRVEYLLDQGRPVIEIPKAPEPKGEWKSFYTKIAGATHRNSDGSDRQQIIPRCQKGERVHLIREPDNPYDPFAVKVVRASGEQLGYLPSEVAGNERGAGWSVARKIDRGVTCIAQIANITGGRGRPYGANLQITFWKGPLALQPTEEPELPALEGRHDSTTASSCASSAPHDPATASTGTSTNVILGCSCLAVVLIAVLLFVLMTLTAR